jgi:hypothetical protein
MSSAREGSLVFSLDGGLRIGIRCCSQIDFCGEQSIDTYQYLCLWGCCGGMYSRSNGQSSLPRDNPHHAHIYHDPTPMIASSTAIAGQQCRSRHCYATSLAPLADIQNYFNKALDTFSTNVVNPIYYVFFTTATIIASAILFQGFNTTGAVNTISLLCGFSVIFMGVYLLNISRQPEAPHHGSSLETGLMSESPFLLLILSPSSLISILSGFIPDSRRRYNTQNSG